MKINNVVTFSGNLQVREYDGSKYTVLSKMKTTPEQDKLITDEFRRLTIGRRSASLTREYAKGLSQIFADIFDNQSFLPLIRPSKEEQKESYGRSLMKQSGIKMSESEHEKVKSFFNYLIEERHLKVPVPESAILEDNFQCIELHDSNRLLEYKDYSVQQGFYRDPRLTIVLDLKG